MNMQDSERPFIRVKARLGGSEDVEAVGDLVITSLRIVWMLNNNVGFECALSRLKKPQYSKANFLIMLLLHANEMKPVFHLQERTESALEKVKAAFRNAMSAFEDSKKLKDGGGGPGGRAPASSHSGGPLAGDAGAQRAALSRNEQRKQMLEVDQEVSKTYRELVKSGTLSEEDFWAFKQEELDQEEGRRESRRMGKTTGLMVDIDFSDKTNVGDGDSGVEVKTFTGEMIESIFRMYPAVYAAYQDKVPREMTKAQFFKLYLKSEYFKRDRAADAHRSAVSLHTAGVANRTDDIFSAYEKKEEVDGTIGTVSHSVHRGVDLTLTAGDRLGIGSARDPDLVEDNLEALPAVTRKYNRNSSLLLSSTSSSSTTSAAAPSAANELYRDTLLERPVAPQLVPLKVKHGEVDAAAAHSASLQEENQPVVAAPSAFGKRQLGGSGAGSGSVSAPKKRTKLAELSPMQLLVDVWDAFDFNPSDPQRRFEYDVWKLDLDSLRAQKLLVQADPTSATAVDLTMERNQTGSSSRSQYGLDPKFRAYISETFKDVTTDCLRYFYSYLDRILQARGNSSANASDVATLNEKMERILKRVDTLRQRLQSDKDSIRDDGNHDVKYPLHCINEVLRLLDRARHNWTRVCEL